MNSIEKVLTLLEQHRGYLMSAETQLETLLTRFHYKIIMNTYSCKPLIKALIE